MQSNRYRVPLVLLLAIALWSLSWYSLHRPVLDTEILQPLPDFRDYNDVSEMKSAFFNYLQPIVEWQNARIAGQRRELLEMQARLEKGGALNTSQRRALTALARQYRLSDPASGDVAQAAHDDDDKALQTRQVAQLLQRVDTIPLELALVQAAKESGWGRSRFARTANNLFGQWCFTRGCGVVPGSRGDGESHELKKFASVSAAIADYLLNLNTHPSYEPMRQIRTQLRQRGEAASGLHLADGLLHYSQRRQAYVDELKAMIHQYRKFRLSAS